MKRNERISLVSYIDVPGVTPTFFHSGLLKLLNGKQQFDLNRLPKDSRCGGNDYVLTVERCRHIASFKHLHTRHISVFVCY